jgi:O-antigen ligase
VSTIATRTPSGILHATLEPRRGAVHWIALALVWVTVASGAIVFTEPAPVDALTLGLIVALPVVGLVSIRPSLLIYLSIWLIAAAGAFVATMHSFDVARSAIHSGVSVYLYVASFVLAAFIVRRTDLHSRLIMHAYLWAATIAAVAGVAGYFALVPGAAELFTKFGRATGTFKDPNVYGPFLIPALLYALSLVVARPLGRAILPALMMALLAFAVLLSFSRGAWAALALALAVYGYLAFVTAPTNRLRLKLAVLALLGCLAGAIALFAALQLDGVGDLLAQRAELTQTYDQGAEGRFGGHAKARRVILDNLFGIGAAMFAERHHSEDVHHVYLSMFLNAGWIGGLVFILMTGITALYGLRHAFRRTLTQPVFLVVYAAFLAHAVEGLVIDIDHWRHYYLLMALVWGLMVGDRHIASMTARGPRPARILPDVMILPPSRPARIPRIVAERRPRPLPRPRRAALLRPAGATLH